MTLGNYLIGHMDNLGYTNYFLTAKATISLATFYIKTLLSPSAVIPLWAKAIPSPNLLADK